MLGHMMTDPATTERTAVEVKRTADGPAMTEEEALTALAEKLAAADDTCSYCQKPNAAHCQDCWHCPGTHDECCGW